MKIHIQIIITTFIISCSFLVFGQTELVQANFNSCSIPNGWSTEVVRGEADWQFGDVDNGNANTPNMDGTCMAYFDDDGVGEVAPFSRVRLITPIFNGEEAGTVTLDFDLIFRKYTDLEHFAISVLSDGKEEPVFSRYEQFGGEQFNDYEHLQIDLSRYRGKEMQVVFIYDDGNDWGWWVGLDNILITGTGSLHDACDRAISLFSNESCVLGDHRNAIKNDFSVDCGNGSKSLWYQFEAQENGWYEIATSSDFNDMISLYQGSNCTQLTNILCDNSDEYGFEGEKLRFEAVQNAMYWIRLAGTESDFGRSEGQHCILISKKEKDIETVDFDLCSGAIPAELNSDCTPSNNTLATTSNVSQPNNIRARSDIWYSFTMDDRDLLNIQSNANFADMISVYSGDCESPVFVSSNERGQRLEIQSLVEGETYFIQLSGFFSTLKGEGCLQLTTKMVEIPANDLCTDAISLSLNGSFSTISNTFATNSSAISSCNAVASKAIWYKFIAPPSGAVLLKGEADFPFTATVFSGNCNEMVEVACVKQPNFCNGNMHISSLDPGTTYFVMVSSTNFLHGFTAGEISFSIISFENIPDDKTLLLEVVEVCDGLGKGVLEVSVSGGSGVYEMAGYEVDEILAHNQSYTITIYDEMAGCERAVVGKFYCPSEENCAESNLALTANKICIVNANGENTGEASIQISASGGNGALQFLGTQNETIMMDGDYYQAAVVDESGCSMVLEGLVYCPKPEIDACANSTLDIDFELTCMYDKFGKWTGKTAVNYSVSGGEPGYEIVGMNQGQIYDRNEAYEVQVIDGLGCDVFKTGVFSCPEKNTKDIVDAELEEFSIYPNPTSSLVNIDWRSTSSGEADIEIMTLHGQVVEKLKFPYIKGMNKILLNLQNYPQNVYLVAIIQRGKPNFLRIIKN